MKLRLAVILPAVVIMIVMATLAYAIPNLTRSLMIAIPVVCVAALGTVFFIERSRHRRVDSGTG
ncbi:hypothetical protein J2S89_000302 [Arthrobacter bambusae]|nr:hypothetical protein [Arthrobacter bambusae]MDQ0096712.1 hypothetical protein [Arthrobacter bambusae]